ncbi:hypothetical protein ACGC1H_005386 [Rhizoctonia solani]
MDIQIEDELRNTIFHDPKFVERFLSGDEDKLRAVDKHCRANDPHYDNTGQWSFPESVSYERQMYRPIANVLNGIKRAVDEVHGFPPHLVHQSGDNPTESELFLDNHLNTINSDLANTLNIKPDLVLFQDEHRHWETVRMPIEVKRLPGHHKAGMKQLSRYARAVFAHQLHRRHLYGMMVCGHEATFVRFDRAGILYSGRIDMVKQSQLFTYALASLLMLDRADEGLDPSFTFRRNQNGRLVYYIDLPESELVELTVGTTTNKSKYSSNKNKHSMRTRSERMRRFEVVERLCHRQSICGRATIVLRIQEVLGHGQTKAEVLSKGKAKATKALKPREYALKLMWRDPQRGSEGDVLEQVHGMFGLAQYAGHWDASMPGKCRCPSPVGGRCKDPMCVDKTVEVNGLEVCDKLRDINILVPDEEDEEQEPVEVDTTECHVTSHVRQLRIYSYLLMSSIGVPLWRADSPRQFLAAVLDAVLGYWRLFNLGIMHRDISDGNVMMLDERQEFDRKDWLEHRESDPMPRVKALFESEQLLRKALKDLGHRNPTGMLSDFDLHALHSSPSDRVGSVETTSTTGPTTRPRDEDTAATTTSAKRRKSNSQRGVPVAQDILHLEGKENTKKKAIDYRTGTPAFMSTYVLEVPAGQNYHHSFLDDMQSFYWLIYWSVAAHLDEGQKRPTPTAQGDLDSMNDSNLPNICSWKWRVLGYCSKRRALLARTLDNFGNEWASSSMFRHVIFHLGALLDKTIDEDARPSFESSPGETISAVVKTILEALHFEA